MRNWRRKGFGGEGGGGGERFEIVHRCAYSYDSVENVNIFNSLSPFFSSLISSFLYFLFFKTSNS